MNFLLKTTLFCAIYFNVSISFGYVYSRDGLNHLNSSLSQSVGNDRIDLLLELSEAYFQFNLDTALLYANQAQKEARTNKYERGFYKGLYCEALINSELKPINEINPIVLACIRWFEKNNYHGDAIKCRVLNAVCVRKLYGTAAARKKAEENLEKAEKLNDPNLLGLVWLDIKKYKPGLIKDTIYPNSLDSAIYYFNLVKDSSNIIYANLYNTLPRNGWPDAFECSYTSLDIGTRWGNEQVKNNASLFIGLGYAGIRNVDSAKVYNDKVIDYAKKVGRTNLLLSAYQRMIYMYSASGNQEVAIEYTYKALDIAIDLNHNSDILSSKKGLANSYMQTERYDLSIKYALEALELAKAQKDEFGIYNLQHLLANVYRSTKEYDKAMEIYNEIIPWIGQTLSGIVKGRTYCNIYSECGKLWQQRGDNEEAMKYFELSIQHTEGLRNRYAIEHKSYYLSALLDINELEKANTFYQAMLEDYSSRTIKASSYFLFAEGRLFVKKGEFRKGVEALKKYVGDNEDVEIRRNHKVAYFDLHKAYEGLGDYKNSLKSLRFYNLVKDSLSAGTMTDNVTRIQANHEISLKESEIKTLEKEKELQAVQLDQKNSQLELRRLYLVIFGIIVFVILITSYFLFRRFRSKKENERLEMKANRTKLELENLQSKQRAEISEIKNVLFANVSHEFRTPLTLIKVPIQSYVKNVPQEDKPIFNAVLKNTDQLLNMIDELLDLGKMETGSIQLNKSNFSLSTFFNELNMAFVPLFREKNITVKWDNQLAEFNFEGDYKKLKIVLNNLLKNAYSHTNENGTIQLKVVALDENNKGLRIVLSNTGKAISPKDLPYIFDRYYRANEDSYSGNGIGLALSKQIVEMHEGKIWAKNNGSEMVCFYINLPGELLRSEFTNLIPEKEAEIIIADNIVESNNTKTDKPTVLVVEDNRDIRNLLNDILRKDFELQFAVDGEVGVSMAHSNQPDLIVSDIMMPKKDGFQLLNELRNNIETSHIPIVLLTAKADSESRITGLDQDADDYIVKPFDPTHLLARIQNLLRQRKRLQKLFTENPFINSKEIKCTKLDAEFIDKARSILEENFDNGEFTVNDFCKALALNRNSVHNKIKSFTNDNTSGFIRNFRLEKAAKLLLETNMSITDVYSNTGFNSPQSFNRVFKDKFKFSPSEFRNHRQK